ncbi:hypothetical protein CPB86DRAFT_2663 [Serendipita vermifera]|nr:hypothetical protein CPB86DRAFT_2663 [Serendipita vermifera]
MHNPSSPSSSSQYGPAASVPLIKSPSLRVPKLVQMPPDIHPLPDSVSAYFVYPFTLESHILTLESQRQATFQSHAVHRAAYLRAREEEKERIKRAKEEEEERRKREALRKVAPGFEPAGGTLVPKRLSMAAPTAAGIPGGASGSHTSHGSISGANAFEALASASTPSPYAFPPPPAPVQQRDVMSDLVDQLAALDAANSKSS